MYGLSQAGRISYDSLVQHLSPYGYHPSNKTPGLWTHDSHPINFTLVVNDFGVKCLVNEHALHVKTALEHNKKVTTEWEGKLYIVISLQWDYEKGKVQIFMPGFVCVFLHSFQHEKPKLLQDSPYPWTKTIIGNNNQILNEKQLAEELDENKQKRIQKIVGKSLYYARAIYSTMLMAMNSLVEVQTKPTIETANKIAQLLNYSVSHPYAVTEYRGRGVLLHIY